MDSKTVVKDGENAVAVPQAWRAALSSIVDALIQGNEPWLPHVSLQSPEVWASAQQNIRMYGAHLMKLPDAAWETSVCIWYGEFWEVLVDLYTEEEGRSDLVLHVRVYEVGDGWRFEVVLVYVP